MAPVPPPSHPSPSGRPGGEQYFTASPASGAQPASVDLTLPDLHVRLRTDAGVFSPRRVDPGTKLLLAELPAADEWPTGDAVDVGAGYGPIAVSLALRSPGRTVWAVEVNQRARDLCAANAADAGVSGAVRVVAPEDVPDDLRVGLVVSNPPIRVGKAVLHDICRTWMERLTDDGAAWWVVQKHLGSDSLQAWLTEQGWPTTRVRSRQSYRVLRSTPRP